MEKLTINNFLIIKNAEFEIKKINLIIGPQANGKSVIAKLTYFFREFLSSTYINSIKNFENKRSVCNEGLKKFEAYFPRYTWNEQFFDITYYIHNSYVKITKSKSNKNEASIKLTYSTDLEQLHRKSKHIYKNKIENLDVSDPKSIYNKNRDLFREVIDEYIYKSITSGSFQGSLFIPASRSFFANLQKNIFSFLASNIDIDPFIKDFGSRYETAKSFYGTAFIKSRDDKNNRIKKIEEISNSILSGKYSYDKEEDWITNKRGRVIVKHSSSGQQEALPLLLTLSLWPFLTSKITNQTYFIEEPEAHLFPKSQKHIVSLIAYIYKMFNQSFVITTHSPYILIAFNNLIFANDAYNSRSEAQLNEIIDPECLVKFEDTTAYTIENGELKSILDYNTRLIGTNIIDAVSDDFDKIFDKIIEIELENQA